jgi:CO/xanthine dehydrogenase FAD-binding subunit
LTVKDYYRPQTLEEAATLLDRFPENTKILAGGTDLIIQMRLKETKPDYLLDLGGLNSLKEIKTKDHYLTIGSMTTFFELEQNPIVQKYLSVLAKASASIGSPQIRSRATIGGNIANAAPAADTLPALLALDSQIKLERKGGTRTASLAQILLGINQTDIKPAEILTHIIIPLPEKDTYQAFQKIGRRKAMAIARLNLALVITFYPEQLTIKEAKIALGAVGKTPYRVQMVEALLKEKNLDETFIEQASELIEKIVAETLGTRPTAPYKKTIAKGALKRALHQILTARKEGANQ